jgi:hypothetical protein
MIWSISVNHSFFKEYQDEEFALVADLYEESRPRIGKFLSCIIPVRTDRFADFFLPSFYQQIGIIALIAAFCFDLLTLPIRALTYIPWHFYQRKFSKETHPLYQHLIQLGCPEKLLSNGYVTLQVENKIRRDMEGSSEVYWNNHSSTFNFIYLPYHVSPIIKNNFSSSYGFGDHDPELDTVD